MKLQRKYRTLVCEGVREALKPALDDLGISADDLKIRKNNRGTLISYNDEGFILEPGDCISDYMNEIKEFLRKGIKEK